MGTLEIRIADILLINCYTIMFIEYSIEFIMLNNKSFKIFTL